MEGVLTSFARVKSTMASQRLIHTKGKLETNLHYIYIYIYIMFVVVVSKFRGPLSLSIFTVRLYASAASRNGVNVQALACWTISDYLASVPVDSLWPETHRQCGKMGCHWFDT